MDFYSATLFLLLKSIYMSRKMNYFHHKLQLCFYFTRTEDDKTGA